MRIDQFLDYLRYERNASPLSVQTYEESLREFESYLTFRDNGLSISSVDTDLIRDWMESLMDKGNSASTINKKLSALRSFYRFALKRQLVKTDPAHAVIGPKKSKPLLFSNSTAMLNQPKDARQSLRGPWCSAWVG